MVNNYLPLRKTKGHLMTIRIRLAMLMSSAMLVMIVLFFYALNEQKNLHEKLNIIRSTSAELISLTQYIDTTFQQQILAWSNLLLRGGDPEEYHRYLQAFYQQERGTRKAIKDLKSKLIDYENAQLQMVKFEESHSSLGIRYRKALKVFNQSENPVYETDRFLWNALDNPLRLLSEIKSIILEHRQEQLILAEKNYLQSTSTIAYIVVVGVLIFISVFIWFTDISFGKPLSKAIKVAEKISAGDYSQRVTEKMPGEFNLFAKAFNYTIDSLIHANNDLQKNMQAMKSEISRRKELEVELEHKKLIAESASKSKSEFLSNMSHEIRTPLNVVTGFSELLAATDVNEKQKKYIDAIQNGGGSLLGIINDVLDLSKIEAGKLSVVKSSFDLFKLMNEVKGMFEKEALEKNLDFEVVISKNVPAIIYQDENRLKQILVNLLSNAIKFTEKGSIELILNALPIKNSSQVDLCFSVEDTGIGIPEEYHHKIFNQFEQQDGQDSRRYGGTGLGLAISQQLATLLNGGMTVSSVPEKGSVFTLCLSSVEVSELLENHTEAEDVVVNLNQSKILIADDIQANRELIKDYLDGQPVEIIEAENGKIAIDVTREYKPDLVLMDIKMPEMDGVEATKILKSDSELKTIPVIALTASSIKGEDAQINDILFDDYLTKPIRKLVLLKSLGHILNDI